MVMSRGCSSSLPDSPWDDVPVRRRLARRMTAEIEPEGWVIDDTGLPKDGRFSPGVGHQYSSCRSLIARAATQGARPSPFGAVLIGLPCGRWEHRLRAHRARDRGKMCGWTVRDGLHIAVPAMRDVLRRAGSALTPGGTLIVVDATGTTGPISR